VILQAAGGGDQDITASAAQARALLVDVGATNDHLQKHAAGKAPKDDMKRYVTCYMQQFPGSI
jgi:hypothetical protein